MATEKSLQQPNAVDLTLIRPIIAVLVQFLSLELDNMRQVPEATVVADDTPQQPRRRQVGTKVQSNASPPPPIIGDEEYTVAQAAIRVKRNKLTVHKWIRGGEIKTRKDDRGRHLIPGRELSKKITKEAMSNGADHTQQ